MTLPSITTFLLGKEFMGVEHFTLNGEDKIALLLVEKKKEGLVISKKDRVSYNGKIAEKWDSKLPFLLVINTNQVIHKEVAGIDASDEKLLYKAFPNTNWDEFYFEIWRLKEKSIVAITRKTYLNEIIANYEAQKIAIAGISLGICAIAEIIEYTAEDKLLTNHQIISKEEQNQIVTTGTQEDAIHYIINDLPLENRQLLAFSGILRFITNTSSNTGSIISYSEELHDGYNQNIFFTKSIKIMVGVLLAILFLNFIFFSHYYSLAQETSETLLVNKSSIQDVSKIKERIIVKEEKVKNIVGKTTSQTSLIINEIASKIPSSILLSTLTFDPLEKKIKAEEPILTTEKTIVIAGTTISNDAFTTWVEAVEKLPKIDQVLITHFGKNDANETEFSIKLTLK
ncbi:general secretion pathway protein [Flavobacterium hercynium]|uniref:General secretion pathway protein n=1 Tax=Flavobacterium hercynium TaxID=387094 RepID=A0A226HBN2_9FLAO|nr:general secretion pathway protein [Flavobacterium hercynium]OXA91096.1 general secretion pathway protein [Flavobacterium hercynium]SMP36649.1 Tfp pilus assembly protein PilN [Flavobacterium hercynium]